MGEAYDFEPSDDTVSDKRYQYHLSQTVNQPLRGFNGNWNQDIADDNDGEILPPPHVLLEQKNGKQYLGS